MAWIKLIVGIIILTIISLIPFVTVAVLDLESFALEMTFMFLSLIPMIFIWTKGVNILTIFIRTYKKSKYLERAREIRTKKYQEYKAVILRDLDKLLHNSKFTYNENNNEFTNLNESVLFEINNGILSASIDKSRKIYLNNEEKIIYIEGVLNQLVRSKESLNLEVIDDIKRKNSLLGHIPKCADSHLSILEIKEYIKAVNNIDEYYKERYEKLKDMKKALEIGIVGEKDVNDYLKLYKDELINLENIRLEVDGESTENDNILITRQGIFIIEVKNIGSSGSYSLEIEKDGRWLKCLANGKKEVIEFNATVQNDRHIILLQRFINSKLGRTINDENYIKVKGMVVLANNVVGINNHSEQEVCRVSEIYRKIMKYDSCIKGEEINTIQSIIENNKLEPKKYPIADIRSEIIENEMVFDEVINRFNVKKDLWSDIENTCKPYIEFHQNTRYVNGCIIEIDEA